MIIAPNKTVHLTHISGQLPANIFVYRNGKIWIDRGAKKSIQFNTVEGGNFTIPIGYVISNITDTIVKDFGIVLPPPERNRAKKYKVVYNKYLDYTPARIFTLKNPAIIEVGNKFYSLPPQRQKFVLLHEIGHMYYSTEEYADLFALKNYLDLGYNASEAFNALAKVLKNPMHPRIIEHYKNIDNYAGKRH